MRSSIARLFVAASLVLSLAACGSGGSSDGGNKAAAPEPMPTEAELANDAALANAAAADEGFDMNTYGGNAAAMGGPAAR